MIGKDIDESFKRRLAHTKCIFSLGFYGSKNTCVLLSLHVGCPWTSHKLVPISSVSTQEMPFTSVNPAIKTRLILAT